MSERTAADAGRICAVAGQGQREMRSWAVEYPGLYEAKAFDPALYSTLALAAAFSGPDLTVAQLRMANKACLWCFGLDWLIDYVAESRDEVDGIIRRCLDVADGAPPVPGDDLTRFLSHIRDELMASPGFPALGAVWRGQLERMLRAMAQEWTWKSARAAGATDRPTFEEYLGNADNLGFSFVFTTHWIHDRDTSLATADQMLPAAGSVQRVIRLINDLGTYERDLSWGDLNGLMLGVDRPELERRIQRLTDDSRESLAALAAHDPRSAGYMERQLDFCAGFYGVTDYWGSL